jgi:CheY-like chemotaxis protein
MLNLVNQKVLTAAGIVDRLSIALNGRQALDLLHKHHHDVSVLPDIILLDLDMPVMDGFQFIDAFNRLSLPDKEKTVFVVFTDSMNPKDKTRAQTMGIKYYLQKPYVLKGIEEVIRKEFPRTSVLQTP